jgi:hypothetical protein
MTSTTGEFNEEYSKTISIIFEDAERKHSARQ